ncbi:HesB/IscA family protein [Candidatus Pyrohabitans sp.]
MVKITERAVEELKKILKEEGKEDYGIKLYIAGAGCSGPSYGMGLAKEAEEGEKEIESNGIRLFLSEAVEAHLEDAEIDYIETPYGAGFAVHNPNAESACGSGCSSCH